ncbi:Fe-Mn family superoxide dismutase [Streptosporangium sp. NPDC023963]|uniref:Fe-Mn family superoxide dismutase n=1 Tax=Streptosporangium sp. NPDC023963 TaxID=3155608 RepID=UPI00343D18A1
MALPVLLAGDLRGPDGRYYLQYRDVRPDYGEKLWSLVDWSDVTQRFSTVTSAKI